ncbi:MAG: S41 family peptidase [Aggregatilineales bacterium]
MQKPSDKYSEFRKSIFIGITMGILLAVVFFAGFFSRDFLEIPSVFASNGDVSETDESYELIDEVQNLLNRHYLREQPEYSQRQYGAIRGVLQALGDRNTFFIEPAVARSESDVLAGTYGGIGVNLSRNADGNFVLFPFPDGPAINAGVQDNDVIISIDEVDISPALQQDAVDQMLRGEVTDGSGVEIVVRRTDANGEESEETIFILFDVINIPSVLWRVLQEDSRIGYLQVMRFTARTPEEVQSAVMSLNEADIESLILDMRNNGGGLLQESVEVASEFLDGGVVLYQESIDSERSFEATADGGAIEVPLVVLVNGGTASAAELVAGALQDYERGILIGQVTYGKGTIQQIFPLSDSSSIHVTSAEWFTPDRNVIDGVGLEPDITMIPDDNGRDIEIGEAVRYLQEQMNIAGEDN